MEIPASRNENPVSRAVRVPLCRPSLGEAEIEAVTEVLRSGLLAHGEYNGKFEDGMSRLLGVPYAVGMNSCASALEVALKVGNIRGEVIIPGFTMAATANAVINAGAVPVFCDVDGPTRNMTAAAAASVVTSRTEAVIPVHFAGQPCNMTDLAALAQRHGLLLVEDSAETLGATWEGRQAGSFGIGCFSFFPTKNITTGEGGMMTCRDAEFARKARALISHGIETSAAQRERGEYSWARVAAIAGHNYRMSNVAAALGYVQLGRLPELNARRIALARRYDESLLGFQPDVRIPVTAPGATHVYQMYCMEVDAANRDRMVRHLRSQGVEASVHFDPPVHMHPYYVQAVKDRFELPVTERLSRESITLPLYPDMTEEDQDRVIECVENAIRP